MFQSRFHEDLPIKTETERRCVKRPMGSVLLKIVHRGFRKFKATRIQQSEVSAGPDKQYTVFKSCVCVGFHHATKYLGAISHITGFSSDGGHSARGALRAIQRKLARFGVDLRQCECFVISGTKRAIQSHSQLFKKYTEKIDTHNVRTCRRLKEVVYSKQRDINAGKG